MRRDQRHEFIETELQRLWRESLTRLTGKLRLILLTLHERGSSRGNAGNMNGRTNWKTNAGETYQKWHEKRLAAVENMSEAAD